MKKILIIFGLICGLNTFSCNYNNLSKDIYKSQVREFGNLERLNTFFEIRNQIQYFSDIQFLVNDTLLLVESYVYNIESGNKSCYLTIFNHNKNFSFKTMITNTNKLKLINGKYKSQNINFEIEKLKDCFIPGYLLSLIYEWNLNEIDKESQRYSVQYPNQIYITRIIINNKKFRIDCHCFDEFYNLQKGNY